MSSSERAHSGPTASMFSRRTFLKYGMAAAVISSSNSTTQLLYADENKTDQFVETFPKEIDGAKSVEKFPAKQSVACLIHIRQKHTTNTNNPKIVEEIKKVQDNIVTIVDTLLQKNLAGRYFYIEAATPITLKEMERSRSELQRIMNGLRAEAHGAGLPEEEITKLVKEIDTKHAEILNGFNGTNRAFMSGKIDYHPGETEEDQLRAFSSIVKALETSSTEGLQDAIFEDRENGVIKRFAADNVRTGVVVYGGSHDFSNNIATWNQAHPKEKLSLIVITPTSHQQKNATIITSIEAVIKSGNDTLKQQIISENRAAMKRLELLMQKK